MDQLNEFIKKAESDEELTKKLETLGHNNAQLDEYIKLAAEYGFTITEDDIKELNKSKDHSTVELNEEDLDNVTGGAGPGEKCFFKPEHPVQLKMVGNTGWVKCGSRCVTFPFLCRCHGGKFCVDFWHVMVQTYKHMWKPAPLEIRNHNAQDKTAYNH